MRERNLKRLALVGLTAITVAACRVDNSTPTVNVPDSSQTDTMLPPSPVPTPNSEIRIPSAQQPEAVPVPEPQDLQMVYQNFNFSYFSNGLIIGGLLSFLLVAILIKRFFSQSLS